MAEAARPAIRSKPTTAPGSTTFQTVASTSARSRSAVTPARRGRRGRRLPSSQGVMTLASCTTSGRDVIRLTPTVTGREGGASPVTFDDKLARGVGVVRLDAVRRARSRPGPLPAPLDGATGRRSSGSAAPSSTPPPTSCARSSHRSPTSRRSVPRGAGGGVLPHPRHYPHMPILLDAKRGDIGSTAEFYAREAFEPLRAPTPSPYNPYLGTDAAEPLLAHGAVFAICRTSNPGSGELQDLDAGGRPLYERVAEMVATRWSQVRRVRARRRRHVSRHSCARSASSSATSRSSCPASAPRPATSRPR